MWLTLFIAIGALPAAAAAAHATPTGKLPEDVLARIDGRVITPEEFRGEMARRRNIPPERLISPEGMESLLREMIRFEVLAANAVSSGYLDDPEVKKKLEVLLVNKFKEDNLQPRLQALSVTDEEIEIYYRENREEFTLPEKVRAAVIHIRVSPKAPAGKLELSRKRIDSALEEARQLGPGTPSFGQVAVKYSEDQATRYRGGDMGWLEKGKEGSRWTRALVETVFALDEPGDLSPVISTEEGFYLVKLMEKRPSSLSSLGEVREKTRYRLLSLKREAVLEGFYREMEEKVKVQVNRDLLGSIKPPVSGGEGMGPPPLPGR